MNILIVKLSAIGDVIHTLPALMALRRHYPEAHISWLVEEAGAELLQGHPALSEVVIWRRRQFQDDLKTLHWIRAIRTFGAVLGHVRGRRYDLIIDFQALLKSGIWMLLARGRRKVGFGRGMQHSEGSYLFLNERIPAVSMEIHALDRGLILLQNIGVPRGELDYGLPRDAAAEADVDRFLANAGATSQTPIVVVHPMTRWQTKLWFNDRFAALADALHEQDILVVFSGGAGDLAALNEIEGLMKSSCHRFDGRGGLVHLAALCRRARVVVSTDTGPMHLAAAVGTRVIALFGPTAPNRTGPYGGQHQVVQIVVPCGPCFKRRCESTAVEEFGCMKRIGMNQVLDLVMNCVTDAAGDRRKTLKGVTKQANAHS